MLVGIQAFEACWTELRGQYPTSAADNTLIAHAMGRLIDRYETPVAAENNLPTNLRTLFRELAKAYFHGYEPRLDLGYGIEKGIPLVSRTHPEVTKATHLSASEQAVIARLKNLANRTPCDLQPGRHQCQLEDFALAETLIIERPAPI